MAKSEPTAADIANAQRAIKQGLHARTVVMPGEDERAYRKMCKDFVDAFKPESTPERELVQSLCDTQWRMGRCARMEARALGGDNPDFKALDSISKHQVHLQKLYLVTLKQVQELINARPSIRRQQMKQTSAIRRLGPDIQ